MHMSRQQESTLIVIPAFNEQDAIGTVLAEIRRYLPSLSILVVNDGSTDETSQVVRENNCPLLELPLNLGVGGAMRAGFKYAIRHGYSQVVQIDADGQHDPQSVNLLVRHLTEFDIVIGSRFAGKGDYKVSGPRKWAMSFLSAVLSRICRTRLTDTTSGLKAIGPRALAVFSRNYPAEYLGDTVEALVIAARARLTVTEIPVEMRERLAGQPSHGGVKSTVQLIRAIMAIFLGLIRPLKS
jgi:glycosyltransferase involved in cell wall biosynthesis